MPIMEILLLTRFSWMIYTLCGGLDDDDEWVFYVRIRHARRFTTITVINANKVKVKKCALKKEWGQNGIDGTWFKYIEF